MISEFSFFKTVMPESRKADFYLGCLDGSVFIDFNQSDQNLISLSRISFDGFGCCNLNEKKNYIDHELSQQFLKEMTNAELNQENITMIVKEVIKLNKEHIWRDALEEYNLLDNH